MEQREREPEQRLRAAYLAIRDNCFWQQFYASLSEKRGYLSRRLREAEDFAAFRYLCGQLELVEQLLAAIAELEQGREQA